VPELLNDHCALESFSRGTLVVIVDSSSHLYQLKTLLLAGLIARSTLERWRTRGVRAADGSRVKLPTLLIGTGLRVTSEQALTWFFAAVNGRGLQPTPREAQRAHLRAERECEDAGI
jgi:hypothetical protein